MRVYIIADMEGASGIYRRRQCHYGTDMWINSGRRALTLSANALASGAFDAGAHEVYYRDIHDTGLNTALKLMDKRVHVSVGQYLKPVMILGAIPSCDIVFFIGHASATKKEAFTPHTMHGHVEKMLINGKEVSEIEIFAAVTPIPFSLAIGDSWMTNEARESLPWLKTVAIEKQHTLHENPDTHQKIVDQELLQLRETAAKTVLEASIAQRYSFIEPVSIEIFVKPGSPLHKNSWQIPKKGDAYIISSDSFRDAYNLMVKFLFFPKYALPIASTYLFLKKWYSRLRYDTLIS